MLLRPFFSILIATLLSVALCAASSSDTSDESNTSLWDMVPDCARNCTEDFIKTEYTPEECTYTTNIKCLCRTETPSNLTIGEAALTCVYALCSQSVIKNTKAYHICDSVSDALPETHATLTATTFAATLASTTRSTSTTSTTSTSSTTSAGSDGIITSDIGPSSTSTSTTSSDAPSITSFHPSTSESGTSPQTISSTSSIETPTNSSVPTTSKSDNHGVSTGTVIGVSVVSGVAGCLIIGVLAFYGVTRWKKNNRVDDSESGGDMFEPAEFPPESFSRESSPGPDPVPWAPNRPPASQEVSQISRPQVFQPTSQYPPRFATGSGIRVVDSPRDENNQRIGFAVTSESVWSGSPRTVDSQHTTAELLPTPAAALYPKPLKFAHRPSSGATLFEEEEGQTITEKKLPSLPSLPSTREYLRNGSPTVMAGLPANPRALKEGFRASQFRRPKGQKKPTQIQPQCPRQAPAGPREKTLGAPFSESSYRRRSMVSNSSSGPNYSSESSDHTSNTFATTPPFSTAQGRALTGMSPRKVQPPGSAPPAGPSSPTSDIVSRPRVVRGDDIKRIQPGSSPRPPSEVVVPYCPDDFWLERGRGNTHSRSASGELPYPSETTLGVILYPSSPKKRPEDAPRRISPTSRNLTPSRRGDDLILSVD
ncbi:hypothetical protein N7478_009922 [Penicillium angulare]|uniref:uncharacterized protein n=1 Tax=Penicillium angulare TaxID=116970 RepID=UPI0025409184|nr:uncharacterized protein N7478_009922 [Penicillium angulare]KAJ5267114.1 hypothetical protein N7478_009922 [Penicillium angulare]